MGGDYIYRYIVLVISSIIYTYTDNICVYNCLYICTVYTYMSLSLYIYMRTHKQYWLVVSTPLKNISQLGLFFPMYGKK